MINPIDTKSFLEDVTDFGKALAELKNSRDILHNFYNFSYTYKDAFFPLSMMIWPIGKLCKKEVAKLTERINTIEQICSVYETIAGALQKGKFTREEVLLMKNALDIQIAKLNKDAPKLRIWHPEILGRVLWMDQAQGNAKELRSYLVAG